MKCFKCEKAAPVFTLYRVNAKGVPGIWACEQHRLERDSELDAIVAAIAASKGGGKPCA
jgi:hypothetical protein